MAGQATGGWSAGARRSWTDSVVNLVNAGAITSVTYSFTACTAAARGLAA